MPGYRTFNHSTLPLWVSIHEEPGYSLMEEGKVAPMSWYYWRSVQYSRFSYYRVRAQWPVIGTRRDEATTNRLDGLFLYKPYTFVEWHGKAWWTRPCWRIFNTLDHPIWVTIYSDPGGKKLDWGEVAPHQFRDWFSGEYAPDTNYRLQASLQHGPFLDVETRATFAGGWGEATLVKDRRGAYSWRLQGVRSSVNASFDPPNELGVTLIGELAAR